MASDSIKKQIKSNKSIKRFLFILSAVGIAISALVTFVVKRDKPDSQNTTNFWVCLSILVCTLAVVEHKTRVFKDENSKYTTRADLSKKDQHYTDIVVLTVVAMVLGVWWSGSLWLFIAIPGYFVFKLVSLCRLLL